MASTFFFFFFCMWSGLFNLKFSPFSQLCPLRLWFPCWPSCLFSALFKSPSPQEIISLKFYSQLLPGSVSPRLSPSIQGVSVLCFYPGFSIIHGKQRSCLQLMQCSWHQTHGRFQNNWSWALIWRQIRSLKTSLMQNASWEPIKGRRGLEMGTNRWEMISRHDKPMLPCRG